LQSTRLLQHSRGSRWSSWQWALPLP
jgi:hypothetical protein